MAFRWSVGVLCGLALALRAWRLGAQSLWSDEDITLDRAGQALGALLGGLPAEQAPLYYVLMRGWTLVAGSGDFALRYPSAVLGVASVPLVGYLGARLLGRRAGLFAAFVAAFNPFLVSYGQEARMYTLLLALALGAPCAVLRAEATGRAAWWVAAGLAASAAVYTHYFGGMVVLALVGWAIVTPWATPAHRPVTPEGKDAGVSRIRPRAGWWIAGAAAFLAFAPWLPRALAALDFSGWRTDLPARDAAWTSWTAWAAGTTAGPVWGPPAAVMYAGFALLGVGAMARRVIRGAAEGGGPPSRLPPALAAKRAIALLVIPLAAYALAVWRTVDPAGNADYDPRYFFAGLPGVLVAVAAGIADLPRGVRGIGLGVVGACAVMPLVNLYTQPTFQKQDYRGFLGAVETAAGHEDTVLFLDGPALGLARRYEMDESPVKIVDLRSSGNRARSDAELASEIAALAAEYPNLWLAYDGEARGVGRAWLETHAYPVSDTAFQRITLSRFYHPSSDPTPARPSTAVLAGVLRSARLPAGVAAGGVLPVRLEWDPLLVEHGSAKLSLRLVSPGDPDASPAAAVDRPILRGPPDDPARAPAGGIPERHGLAVPAGTIPGRYAVRGVVYLDAASTPLAVLDLGTVDVTAAP